MESDAFNVRPRVPVSRGSASVWLFGLAALMGAGGLFAALDANRRAITAPATRPLASDFVGARARVPELAIPPYLGSPTQNSPLRAEQIPLQPIRPITPTVPSTANRVFRAREGTQYTIPPVVSGQDRLLSVGGPGVVYDARLTQAGNGLQPNVDGNGQGSLSEAARGPERVKAAKLVNPSVTISQGSVIQGVLETALDTTRSGLARAIVSRDVRGFDGTRVLVPRGSRLIGEYQSDVSGGQSRALIRWTRLIRPDGVTMAIQSPSADTLGRAGVKGKVNTHFFERFGGAILQSTLDAGVGLATRSVSNGTVIVGLPGSSVSTPRIVTDNQVKPTVTVKQGASVSVFVARDLDFSGADETE